MKLEELARRSSTEARVSVAHLETPPIGAPSPNRSWVPLLAGVAVSALVVGGLAALARDQIGSDTPAPADSMLPTVDDVPKLGLDLDGWTVSFAAALDDLNDGSEQPKLVYYGNSDAEDPYENGDLVIVSYPHGDAAPLPSETPASPEEGAIELRGTTATVSSGTDQGLPVDSTSITWTERDADGATAEIVLISRTFDVDQLTRIAEALAIDVPTATVTIDDELDLDRVATTRGTPFDATRGSGEGYVVAYRSDDASDYVVISTSRGDLTAEATALRWWAQTVEEIDIGDRPGVLATFAEASADLGPIVTWSPADGIIASVSRLGTDSPDVTTLAATAFEIDDATWESYVAATDVGTASANEYDEIFGQDDGVQLETEYSWVLGVQGTDLCFDMQVGNAGTGSCRPLDGADAPDGGARTIDNGFGDTIASVVIVADPAVDDIIETTGSYAIDRVEAAGNSWFVAIGDTDVQPSFDVIVDGAVVDTLEAGVEAVAETQPSLSDNPAATELGITDMDVITSQGSASGLSWSLGRNGDDLCVVTHGEEPAASCSRSADIVVFPPVPGPSDQMTTVVVTDPPACVDSFGIDGQTIESVATAGDERNSYQVLVVAGESDGWVLRLDSSTGSVGSHLVDLPPVEGIAGFPATLCQD